MRRDAFLGHLVHFFGADLHLEGRAVFGNHGRVQRLIKIRPRHRNEVLDASRHRPPYIVNDAQHRVAILHRARDDAHGIQIVDLVHVDALPHQFLMDAVEALGAALYLGGNAGFLQLVAYHAFHARQERLAHFPV